MPRLGVIALGTLLVAEAFGFAIVGVPQGSGRHGKRPSFRAASCAKPGTRTQTHALQEQHHQQHLGVGLGGRGEKRASILLAALNGDGDGEEDEPAR